MALQEDFAVQRKCRVANHWPAIVHPGRVCPWQFGSRSYRSTFSPEPSYLGIGLLVAAVIVMPWLSNQKRSLAARISSASLKADAVQSSMCGYLAWIALGGLALNAFFKLSWADPVAALLLLPIVVREGLGRNTRKILLGLRLLGIANRSFSTTCRDRASSQVFGTRSPAFLWVVICVAKLLNLLHPTRLLSGS